MSSWTMRKQRVAVLASIIGLVLFNALFILYASHAFSKCPLHPQLPAFLADAGAADSAKELQSNVFNKKLSDEVYALKTDWFAETCMARVKRKHSEEDGGGGGSGSTLVMSIEDIGEYLSQWQNSDNRVCNDMFSLFHCMFELEVTFGQVRLADAYKSKVLNWLNNNPALLARIYNQKIIKLYNRFYHDEMIFNGMRGKRPQLPQTVSDRNYSVNLVHESMKSCDFCGNTYKTNTASETFERIETPLSYTTANTFKYDKWHSLIVSRNHDTLNLNLSETIDMFRVSLLWYDKVYELDKEARYPAMIWDAMLKSGASQIHTHMQCSMGVNGYYGVMRRWVAAARDYVDKTTRDYLADFVLLHRALGLVYEPPNTRGLSLILNLIPLKDQELMIVTDKTDEAELAEFATLVHHVIRIFIDKMDHYSFSAGMYLPEYGSERTLNKLFFKILFRSPAVGVRSDFNGLDLYTSSVIVVDRYQLARTLFGHLETIYNSSKKR